MDKVFRQLESYSSKYDSDILKYGFQVLLFNFISVVVILLISWLLDKMLYGCLFMLSFGFMRIKIGGFHCKTLLSCLSSMVGIYLCVLMLSEYVMYHMILKVMSVLCICFLFRYMMIHKKSLMIPISYLGGYIVLFNHVIFTPIYSGLFLAVLLYMLNVKKEI